jgi:hypothetical protein
MAGSLWCSSMDVMGWRGMQMDADADADADAELKCTTAGTG